MGNVLFTIFRPSECFSVSLKHSLDSLDFFCQKIIFQIHSTLVITNLPIRPVLFVISNNLLYQIMEIKNNTSIIYIFHPDNPQIPPWGPSGSVKH